MNDPDGSAPIGKFSHSAGRRQGDVDEHYRNGTGPGSHGSVAWLERVGVGVARVAC